ncbi:hypothetical protein NC651_026427 [Populus alba x Populus x berolinensis]|nr:hypothetical protein NC651_026427 [Populus alba x Populus x berolinensis]
MDSQTARCRELTGGKILILIGLIYYFPSRSNLTPIIVSSKLYISQRSRKRRKKKLKKISVSLHLLDPISASQLAV